MKVLETRSAADPPRIADLLQPGSKPLEYRRYLQVQEKLRALRRELLVFCEHPPTITAGVQSRPENLRSDSAALQSQGVNLVRIGRGGDYTAHEPGQCVLYPHIDLRRRGIGISEYFRALLEITAESMYRSFGIAAESWTEAPGLYAANGAKIASIGIMFKGFFTSHGLAVNVGNNLEVFRHINPCGFADLEVTSVAESGGDPGRLREFLSLWRQGFEEFLGGRS